MSKQGHADLSPIRDLARAWQREAKDTRRAALNHRNEFAAAALLAESECLESAADELLSALSRTEPQP